MKQQNDEDGKVLFNSFRAGVIALVFLLIGFQLALFVQKAAQTRILANRDQPDTVFVYASHLSETSLIQEYPVRDSRNESANRATVAGNYTERRNAQHAPAVEHIRQQCPPRHVESFRFNPNTVSVEDLVRLGFSPKQAESIENYRQKGGRFRRKEDFAKSFVVSDSVYKRLEHYIEIPLLDINKADSASFDALPGIGPYFASKMVSYREQLGGYSCKEQLMEIYHFDQEKFDGLKDLIKLSAPNPFRLWSLPADSLKLHPHIRDWRTARAIVLYRENNDRSQWTVDGLEAAGILDAQRADCLRRCIVQ